MQNAKSSSNQYKATTIHKEPDDLVSSNTVFFGLSLADVNGLCVVNRAPN